VVPKSLRRTWLSPLIFFQAYLSLTVLLFFFGPWPWEVDSPLLLTGYLIGAQMAIACGYLLAWQSVRGAHRRNSPASTRHAMHEGRRFLRLSLVVTFVLLVPTSLSRTGSVLPNVIEGLSNVGAVYNENVERLEGGNAFVLVEYLRMLLSPMLVAVLPLTVVYWSTLSGGLRIASVLAIGSTLSLYVATGTNKGLADLLVITPWFVYLGVRTGVLQFRVSRRAAVVAFVVLFAGFLQFFGAGQTQREGGVGEFGVLNTGLSVLQADSGILSDLLSDNLRIIFESLTRYVVSGYYALSLSMQLDHDTTLGFGHSMFLARNANAIFDTTYFTAQSLPGLIEERFGWGMFTLWHSIYPWLASDFGYFGSLLVIGVFSYLLSLSWGMSLATLRFRWLSMTYLMLIVFFYIPANNQIFQSGETCVAFFMILASLAMQRRQRPRTARKPPRDLELPAAAQPAN
jgi:hypothetical protein